MRMKTASSSKHAQQGVVLFVALIVLVVMALAGVAMMRQSGAGLSIAGNVGMKQNATSAGDFGTEAAIAWWLPLKRLGSPVLNNDVPAEGYFSNWGVAGDSRLLGDPTRYPWDTGTFKTATTNDGTNNEVRYIVERMCLVANQTGEAAGQMCVNSKLTEGTDHGGGCGNYPQDTLCQGTAVAIHYRISSRIQGPKNTFSYIQVMVQ